MDKRSWDYQFTVVAEGHQLQFFDLISNSAS